MEDFAGLDAGFGVGDAASAKLAVVRSTRKVWSDFILLKREEEVGTKMEIEPA